MEGQGNKRELIFWVMSLVVDTNKRKQKGKSFYTEEQKKVMIENTVIKCILKSLKNNLGSLELLISIDSEQDRKSVV